MLLTPCRFTAMQYSARGYSKLSFLYRIPADRPAGTPAEAHVGRVLVWVQSLPVLPLNGVEISILAQ